MIEKKILTREIGTRSEVEYGKTGSRERSIMNNRISTNGEKRRFSVLTIIMGALICLALLQVGPALAEDQKYPGGFMLRLGGYSVSNAETIARLDANNAPVGAHIDFTKDLGLDTTAAVLRLDGLYRFNEHHGLGFGWYALKFTGSRYVGREINWGDLPPITIGTQVDSQIRFDVYKLNYQYSLFHNDQAELGVLAGLHIMKTFVGFNAVGIGETKNTAVTAPLPVLGLYADYNFTPRMSAFYNLQFFAINYENKAKGNLQDFLLGVEYRLFKNIALGVAYNRFVVNLALIADAATLTVNTGWNGGMLYGSLYF